MIFKNRADAGDKLAEKLKHYENTVILAIPRGGVETALPIAIKLEAPLCVIVSRKITVPQYPEVAVGAVTADGSAVYSESYVEELGLSKEEVCTAKEEAIKEAKRRERVYISRKCELKNKVAIVVDDGLATGYTMLSAVKSVRKSSPKKIIVAVPVASPDAHDMVKRNCDELVCLQISDDFFAVGAFYEDFPQLSDADVISILKKANK